MRWIGASLAALATLFVLGGCNVCVAGCKQTNLAHVVTRVAATPQGGVVVTRCQMDSRTTRVSFSNCTEVEIPPEGADGQ